VWWVRQMVLAVSQEAGLLVLLSASRLDRLEYLDQIQLEGTVLDAQIQVGVYFTKVSSVQIHLFRRL
jgi:hypothetical protein